MAVDVSRKNLPSAGNIIQLEIANEHEMEYYTLVMNFRSIAKKFPFLVTESMLESCVLVVDDSKPVVKLCGAKGTGKSTTCLFHYHWTQIQKPSSPFLAISAKSLKQGVVLKDYLERFKEHLKENVALDPNDSYMMVMNILRAPRKQENAYAFFDVGNIGKDSNAITSLSNMIDIANVHRWNVIVALSSGGNFMMSSYINQDFKQARESFIRATKYAVPVEVKDFSDDEAKTYMDFHKVVSSKRYLRNPLLLSYYANVHNRDEKVVESMGNRHIQNLMMQIVNEAIAVLKLSDSLLTTLENSLPFLARAQKGHVLTNEEYEQYQLSYVCMESLAVTEETDEGYQLKAHFPELFPLFVHHVADRLRNEYPATLDILLKNAHVRGTLFEIQVLRKLKNIHVSAANCDNRLKTFKFKVRGAVYQESHTLKAPTRGQIYYLRPSHPAIDAVCYAVEVDTKELYLLLIQVSISEYKNHAAKAIDITKRAPTMEGGNRDISLAEYYMGEFHDETISEDHVIYVYISPTDLYNGTVNLKEEYFCSQTQSCSLRSGRNPAKFWCGLITDQSGSANETFAIFESVKLGK